MKNLLSLVLASMISVVSSAGSIYYVSPDGTDDAACTYDNPGSISAALALAEGGESWEDGDTIIFKDGKYSIPTKGQAVTYTINGSSLKSVGKANFYLGRKIKFT